MRKRRFLPMGFANHCYSGDPMRPVCSGARPEHASSNTLGKALENAQSITNIEIQYDDTLWIKGKPISVAESNNWTRTMNTSYPFSKDFTRTFHITYTASERNTEPNPAMISSVDEHHQNFSNSVRWQLWSEFNGSTAYMVEQDGDTPGDNHNPTVR